MWEYFDKEMFSLYFGPNGFAYSMLEPYELDTQLSPKILRQL
jgi:hypothetical protein